MISRLLTADSVTAVPAPDLGAVRILVVGDVMLDRYWFGEVSRISPEAPVPVVRIEKREERLGGAANVARNAAALGAHCGLLGVVGADEAGAQVGQLLDDSSIVNYLQRDEAISTIIKLRVIGRQQQLLRIDFEDAPTDTVLRDKLTDILIPGYSVEFDPDEAEQAGAFQEDALSEQDASESCLDLVDGATAAFDNAREAT